MNKFTLLAEHTSNLPPFTPLDPELWFYRVENIFICKNIVSDQMKYSVVVSNLDPKYLAEVRDLVVNPPEIEKYEKLKSELKNRFSVLLQDNLMEQLENAELGNRTPTEFLLHLQKIGGLTCPDSILRVFWQRSLPTVTRKILATQNDLPLNRVAELADAITEFSLEDSAIAVLKETVDVIASDVYSTLQLVYRELVNRDTQQQSQSNMNSNLKDGDGICSDHMQYGAAAQYCVGPHIEELCDDI